MKEKGLLSAIIRLGVGLSREELGEPKGRAVLRVGERVKPEMQKASKGISA